jgi:hypothetical protein
MSDQTRTADGAAFNLDGSDPSFERAPADRVPPRDPRWRMRLRVTTEHGSSFTVNVSAGGVCTEQMRVLAVGTPLDGHVFIEGRDAPFVGRVAWARSGDSRLGQLGRMGICFERIDPGFARSLSEREGRAGAAATGTAGTSRGASPAERKVPRVTSASPRGATGPGPRESRISAPAEARGGYHRPASRR